jgi:hypothetical protein
MDAGLWVPQKWGDSESTRRSYDSETRDAAVGVLAEERPTRSGRVSSDLFLKRQAPRMVLWIRAARIAVPELNTVSVDFDAAAFRGEDATSRLVSIVGGLVRCTEAALVTGWHSDQCHTRFALGNPLARLERMNWLTYFGPPYLDLLSEQRILSAPGYRRERLGLGALVLAAPRPDSVEMTTSGDALMALEHHLGELAFAGLEHPHEARVVPRFDVTDVVMADRRNH